VPECSLMALCNLFFISCHQWLSFTNNLAVYPYWLLREVCILSQ
jgi:hypothetical protein